MKIPQWVADGWDNVTTVTAAAWQALPQGARDFLKGFAFGLVIGMALVGSIAWGRP